MQERPPGDVIYYDVRVGIRASLQIIAVHIKDLSHNSQEYNFQTNYYPNPNPNGAGGRSS